MVGVLFGFSATQGSLECITCVRASELLEILALRARSSSAIVTVSRQCYAFVLLCCFSSNISHNI